MNRLRPPPANEAIHGDPALNAAIVARERVVGEYHKATDLERKTRTRPPPGVRTNHCEPRPTTPAHSGRAT
ncbi:hypothetical protein R8510_04992 [Ralstonia chuxiongensis]|nr:hypothetical protein R8510_04992 [Ralstonia chuxiongensis]